MIANRYCVSGKVQGVGFRRFVQKQAEELGLAGWTRNLIDGRVEVHAEGSPEKLKQLEEKLKKGPIFSFVEAMISKLADVEGSVGFEVRPDGEGK